MPPPLNVPQALCFALVCPYLFTLIPNVVNTKCWKVHDPFSTNLHHWWTSAKDWYCRIWPQKVEGQGWTKCGPKTSWIISGRLVEGFSPNFLHWHMFGLGVICPKSLSRSTVTVGNYRLVEAHSTSLVFDLLVSKFPIAFWKWVGKILYAVICYSVSVYFRDGETFQFLYLHVDFV